MENLQTVKIQNNINSFHIPIDVHTYYARVHEGPIDVHTYYARVHEGPIDVHVQRS